MTGGTEEVALSVKLWVGTAFVAAMGALQGVVPIVIGQTTAPTTMGEAIPGLTNLGAVGVLAWLAWHITTKGQPKLMEEAQKERTKLMEEAQKERTSLIASVMDSQRTLMEAYAKHIKEIMDQVHLDRQDKTAAIRELADQIDRLPGAVLNSCKT